MAAAKLHDVTKAYKILETARGRSRVGALRQEPLNTAKADSTTQAAQKEINQIQLALLRETNRNERRKLLDRLEEEQILAPVVN